VTGIEIENSINAIVENNYVHDNTGGILVFVLPNNVSKVGRDCIVRNNRVINNNLPNFAKPNSIVSRVMPGTGVFIMAADNTEVTANEIRGNDCFGFRKEPHSMSGRLLRITGFTIMSTQIMASTLLRG
jgi:parallel beta-helix repeat protein